MIKLIVKYILNSTNTITVEQGKQLANVVLIQLTDNKQVILDLKDVSIITAVFLNSFFNELLSQYNNEFISYYLKYNNVNDKFLVLIRLVRDNVTTYYDNNVIAKVINNTEV